MKKINVGILGGGEVASHLIAFFQSELDKINLVGVVVRDINKPRHFDRFPHIIKTTNWKDVIDNQDVDIIIDCLSGVEAPKQALYESLSQNKTVISCGKELWQHRNNSDILIETANANNVTVWLNSILSNYSYDYNILPEDLTHKTIRNYPDQHLYADRYGGAMQTAAFILQDVFKAGKTLGIE